LLSTVSVRQITRARKKDAARGLHQTSIESDRIAKMIFDKQLAAFGQLKNKLGSLNPAKSKWIGLDAGSIQLWVHSEKGAKRVKPIAMCVALL